MATFDEVLQTYVNLDYSQLLSIAEKSFGTLHRAYTNDLGSSEKSVQVIMSLVFVTVCADGTLSNLEAKFLNDFAGTNYSVDQLIGIAQNYNSDRTFAAVDKLYDSMPQSIKNEMFILCLCVAAVDERISKEEISYIKQLMA